jgi:hypothetical protein
MIAARFPIVMFDTVEQRDGFVIEGLGLVRLIEGIPEFNFESAWGLYHLGSGHCILTINCDRDIAFAVAREVAAWGDWSFDSPFGWQNHVPEFRRKVHALRQRIPEVRPVDEVASESLARQVMELRERPCDRKLAKGNDPL